MDNKWLSILSLLVFILILRDREREGVRPSVIKLRRNVENTKMPSES